MDLFIYYQVPLAQAATLEPVVRRMQASLATEHGVSGQLKFRPRAKDGLQTWMEIYPATSPAFGAALEAAVNIAQLAALGAGARHTEQFTDALPCA